MTHRTDRTSTVVFFTSLILLLASVAFPIIQATQAYRPVAENGIIDLRDWDCRSNDIVKLDGAWLLYWGQLLTPDDVAGGRIGQPLLMDVPKNWDAVEVDGAALPVDGYATYRLQVLLSCDQGTFGVKTNNIRASNRIFVNGTLVGSSGSPATNAETIVHRNTPYTAFFELDGQRELDILVQVASFKSYNTGMVQSLMLGGQQAIAAKGERDLMLDGVITSGFAFIGLYFFFIYFQRRGSKELLFFALFCFTSSVFTASHTERLLFKLVPSLDVMSQLVISNLSTIGVFAFFSRYAYYLLPSLYSKKVIRIIDAVMIMYVVLILFTPATYSALYISTIVPLSVVSMGTNGYYMLRAALKRTPGTAYLALSAVCLGFLIAIGAMNTLWKLDAHFFLPLAQPVLIISQALYMSLTYTNAFRTIQRLTERLTAADKLKDEFLANTSHEFKSPLNGIINISQSLLTGARGNLEERQREDLLLVRETGKRLASLVNDILDYSRMKHSDITLYPSAVDVSMIAQVTIDMYSFLNRNPSLQLANRIPPGRYYAYADENRLHQIVRNLIDNGIKYTKSGVVAVEAVREQEQIRVMVEDTGIGIASEHLERIFRSFEQFEPDLSRRLGGVGLGLTVTKQLVELHGGRIWAESELGKGTRINFTMPAAREEEAKPKDDKERMGEEVSIRGLQQAAAATITEGSGPYRILIADDDYGNLRTLLNILTRERYQVTAASSGEEALELLDGVPDGDRAYDLCVVDVMMPGLSGYDVCQEIRKRYSILELPVLLVTAGSRAGDVEAGFSAGANDFLKKPYDVIELVSRVRTLVELKQSAGRLVQKELAFLQAQIKPHFLFNTLNTILSLSHSNHEKARKILKDFSVYLRHSFDFRESSGTVPLSKELSLVQAYVEIEKARFGDLLSVEFHVDPEALPVPFPTLTLQPIVENAIHHGVMKQESGGIISVSIRVHQELEIMIEDNGVGFSETTGSDGSVRPAVAPSKHGVGLANIRRRLKTLYGSELLIESKAGEGTTVTIRIPLPAQAEA